jgi:hypothetical protein
MLKKCYAGLVQELKMMSVKRDIRMMYNRKMELTKKLNKTEKAMKVFPKPETSVKLYA